MVLNKQATDHHHHHHHHHGHQHHHLHLQDLLKDSRKDSTRKKKGRSTNEERGLLDVVNDALHDSATAEDRQAPADASAYENIPQRQSGSPPEGGAEEASAPSSTPSKPSNMEKSALLGMESANHDVHNNKGQATTTEGQTQQEEEDKQQQGDESFEELMGQTVSLANQRFYSPLPPIITSQLRRSSSSSSSSSPIIPRKQLALNSDKEPAGHNRMLKVCAVWSLLRKNKTAQQAPSTRSEELSTSPNYKLSSGGPKKSARPSSPDLLDSPLALNNHATVYHHHLHHHQDLLLKDSMKKKGKSPTPLSTKKKKKKKKKKKTSCLLDVVNDAIHDSATAEDRQAPADASAYENIPQRQSGSPPEGGAEEASSAPASTPSKTSNVEKSAPRRNKVLCGQKCSSMKSAYCEVHKGQTTPEGQTQQEEEDKQQQGDESFEELMGQTVSLANQRFYSPLPPISQSRPFTSQSRPLIIPKKQLPLVALASDEETAGHKRMLEVIKETEHAIRSDMSSLCIFACQTTYCQKQLGFGNHCHLLARPLGERSQPLITGTYTTPTSPTHI